MYDADALVASLVAHCVSCRSDVLRRCVVACAILRHRHDHSMARHASYHARLSRHSGFVIALAKALHNASLCLRAYLIAV